MSSRVETVKETPPRTLWPLWTAPDESASTSPSALATARIEGPPWASSTAACAKAANNSNTEAKAGE